MAQEAVLTVSLKDYKKQIDDLRASLLNLDSADQQYLDTAEQIKSMQEKLNEVMGIGKKDVDAVAGSYNALSQELSALKKEWKSLEIGSDRWVELGNQIDDINNKLKEADATVGVFGRNVGNYQNAFEGAAKSMLSQLGSVNPLLGKMGSTVSQLIPVIKNVSKAATAGLKGIKAAIASTGIGALIIALGILTTYVTKNWDAIKDWASGHAKARKEMETNKKALEDLEKAHQQYIKVLQGQGASSTRILAEELRYLHEVMISARTEYGNVVREFGYRSKEAASALTAANEETEKFLNQVELTKVALDKFISSAGDSNLTELERKIKNINGEYEDWKATVELLRTEHQLTTEEAEKYLAVLEQIRNEQINNAKTEEAKKRWKEEETAISSLTKTIQDSFKTREQLLTEQYNKEKKLLQKHHKDTTALEKKYQNDMKRLMLETQDAILNSFNNLSSLNSAYTFDALSQSLDHANARLKMFADIVGSNEFMPPGPPLEKTVKMITQDMAQMAYETGLIERADITEFAIAWQVAGTNVKFAQNALSSYSYTFEKLEDDYEEYMKKMPSGNDALEVQIKRHQSFIAHVDEVEKRWKELPDLIQKASGEEREALEKDYDDISRGIVRIKNLRDAIKADVVKLQAELANNKIETQQRRYDNRAESANTNTNVSGFWNTTDFQQAYEARIKAEEYALASINQLQFDSEEEREAAYLEHQQRLLDIQKEYNEAKYQNYAALGEGIASIFDAIGNIYEQDISNQVKHGKLSEKEAEQEYKKVQGIKIAVATIDTIQGALAAFMGWQEVGQPWGAIIGAVQAAAVTAAGIAQIAQIKNTNPYSNSTPTSSAYASSTPTMKDFTPDYFTNVTGANDTQELANAITEKPIRAYVVEADITDAQELAYQREAETTF